MEHGRVTVLVRRGQKLQLTTGSKSCHRALVQWCEDNSITIIDEFWGFQTYEVLAEAVEVVVGHFGGCLPGDEEKLGVKDEMLVDAEQDQPVYWLSTVPPMDDFGNTIHDEFVDGKLQVHGCWALMAPVAWQAFGIGRLGTGLGQRYRRQDDGRWLKVEG